MNNINIEKTKKYYDGYDSCDCAYCKNFSLKIRKVYPLICEKLESMGIDPAKPFELCPIEFENIIEYSCQYVVFGECCKQDGEVLTTIDDINIWINNTHHPNTNILENHFVIEFGPIYLEKN